jgi:hypothetical protein
MRNSCYGGSCDLRTTPIYKEARDSLLPGLDQPTCEESEHGGDRRTCVKLGVVGHIELITNPLCRVEGIVDMACPNRSPSARVEAVYVY